MYRRLAIAISDSLLAKYDVVHRGNKNHTTQSDLVTDILTAMGDEPGCGEVGHVGSTDPDGTSCCLTCEINSLRSMNTKLRKAAFSGNWKKK